MATSPLLSSALLLSPAASWLHLSLSPLPRQRDCGCTGHRLALELSSASSTPPTSPRKPRRRRLWTTGWRRSRRRRTTGQVHYYSSQSVFARQGTYRDDATDIEEPKIADFGLARLLGEGHTHTRTTRVVGTFGYMAPEYAKDGSASPKIDIFSFGVLVLEIVTRRRNCSSDDHDAVNLLSDVWTCWTKGTISQMNR